VGFQPRGVRLVGAYFRIGRRADEETRWLRQRWRKQSGGNAAEVSQAVEKSRAHLPGPPVVGWAQTRSQIAMVHARLLGEALTTAKLKPFVCGYSVVLARYGASSGMRNSSL
jgi:hypothetical protein